MLDQTRRSQHPSIHELASQAEKAQHRYNPLEKTMTKIQKVKELRRRTGCSLSESMMALRLHHYNLQAATTQLQTGSRNFTAILIDKILALEARIQELEEQ